MRWLIASLLLCSLAPLSLAADDTPALINEALDKPVAKLEVNGVLRQAMEKITKDTSVPIEAESEVWDLLPWGEQTNISAKIENQTVRQALQAITRKLGLTFEVKETAVLLEPLPALRRLGRRATAEELAALETLASTQLGLKENHIALKALADAVDQKLSELKSPFATEYRPGDVVSEKQEISIPRNATMLEALECIPKQTGATWYAWGKSILIVSKEDAVRHQLEKTISARYDGVDVQQVLTELSSRAGVHFDIEPGAIARISADLRTIRKFRLENVSISQALETLAGITGLGYMVKDSGVYVWNSANAPAGRERIVGLITLPDLGIQVLVPESQVTADMREYIHQKTAKELEKLRSMMKEEGWKSTTKPATKPTGDEPL
ncbi:MAG TPA: hypothetical protein VIL86_06290 [Tepidisphaeraceae bacterium]